MIVMAAVQAKKALGGLRLKGNGGIYGCNWYLLPSPPAGASASGPPASAKTSPLYSYLLKKSGFGESWLQSGLDKVICLPSILQPG